MPSAAGETRESAGQDPRAVGPRLVRDWGALDRDRRLAVGGAVALFATMLLPWYQQNAVVSAARAQPLVSRNLNAFAVFSFVEAAVLLVAVAVLVLLYARAEGRDFHLPGGDGAVIFAAGVWTALLLVLRLFDKPGITHNGVAANVGIQWGIFFALAAAGLLAYAGSRIRAGRRPGPPVMRGEYGRPEPRAPQAAGRHEQYGPPEPERFRREMPEAQPEIQPKTAPAAQDDRRGPPEPERFRRETPAPPAAARHDRQGLAEDEREQHPGDEPTIVVSRNERSRYPPTPAERAGAPAAAEQLSFEESPDDAAH